MSIYFCFFVVDVSFLLDYLIGNDDFCSYFIVLLVKVLVLIGLDGVVGENDCMKIGILVLVEELSQVCDGLQVYLFGLVVVMIVVFCFEVGKVGECIDG